MTDLGGSGLGGMPAWRVHSSVWALLQRGCVHTEIRGIDIIRQLTSQRVLNLRHGKGQAGLLHGLYSLEIAVSASAALFKALPIPIVDIRYLRA